VCLSGRTLSLCEALGSLPSPAKIINPPSLNELNNSPDSAGKVVSKVENRSEENIHTAAIA
jgi:hypothetical protein